MGVHQVLQSIKGGTTSTDFFIFHRDFPHLSSPLRPLLYNCSSFKMEFHLPMLPAHGPLLNLQKLIRSVNPKANAKPAREIQRSFSATKTTKVAQTHRPHPTRGFLTTQRKPSRGRSSCSSPPPPSHQSKPKATCRQSQFSTQEPHPKEDFQTKQPYRKMHRVSELQPPLHLRGPQESAGV